MNNADEKVVQARPHFPVRKSRKDPNAELLRLNQMAEADGLSYGKFVEKNKV